MNTRPFDYFDSAALILLGQFVELCALQEKNFANMAWNPTSPLAQKQIATLQAAINSTAVKLRITPSAVLSKKDGRLDETEIDTNGKNDSSNLLFGGSNVVRF